MNRKFVHNVKLNSSERFFLYEKGKNEFNSRIIEVSLEFRFRNPCQIKANNFEWFRQEQSRLVIQIAHIYWELDIHFI